MELAAPLLNFIGTIAIAILAASLASWTKKSEWKRDVYRQMVATRQRLYTDFLAEANRLVLTSLDEKTSKAVELHQMTGYLSQIELLSSDPVVKAAKAICACVVDSHAAFSENPSHYAELKAAFIEAARKEIGEYEP